MLRRPTGFRSILLVSSLSLFAGLLVPAFAGLEAAQAASSKPSLDLCVVEPGFATPGDQFALTTTGPKNFSDTAQLQASACGSYKQLNATGSYTVTQSTTAAGWSLGGIYCYSIGSANQSVGTPDQSSSSVTLNVNGPTSCIFAETQGGGGGGGTSGGGFSGGSGKSGTTSTTSKSGTTTTTTKKILPPAVNFCIKFPSACKFHPVNPIQPG
jgi:hypothetical protein